MPVKASFNVDFESFRSEVEKSIVALDRFEGDVVKVEDSLSAMANKFTGVKLVSEATLMAEAIERIGGVSKLTSAELEKVGQVAATAAEKLQAWGQDVPQKIAALTQYADGLERTIAGMTDKFSGVTIVREAAAMTEAIARVGGTTKLTSDELLRVGTVAAAAAQKLRAIGEDVPPEFTKLIVEAQKVKDTLAQVGDRGADGAKRAATEFTALNGIVGNLASTILAAFSLRAIEGFTFDTLNAARAQRALSYETGISTEEIQLLGQTSKEYGLTADQTARAVDMLVKRIAGDEHSATAAVHSFGLTMEELKTKTPIDLFRTVMTHLAAIGDEFEQQHVAAGLFGERMGRVMVRLSQDFDQTYDHLKQLGTVLTDEQTKNLAHAADQWDEFVRRLKLSGASTVDGLLTGFNAIGDALDRGATKFQVLKALSYDYITNTPYALAGLLAGPPAAPAGDVVLPKDRAPVVEASNVERLLALMKDDTKELTSDQKDLLNALFDIGKLTKANAESFTALKNVSAASIEQYKKHQDEIVTLQQHLSTELREQQNLVTTTTNRYTKELDDQNKKTLDRLASETAFVGALIQEDEVVRKINADRNLGPQTDATKTAMDQLLAQLTEIEAQADRVANAARDRALGDAARRAKLKPEDIGFLSPDDYKDRVDQILRDYNQMLATLKAVTGPQVQKVWQEFDEKLFGPLNRAIRDTSAMFGEQLLPWSTLGPGAIGVKPIVAGSFGGVGTVNVHMQVSGIWDPATTRQMTDAVSQQLMRDAGRR